MDGTSVLGPFFGFLELFRCLLGASRPTIFFMLPKDDDDDVIELPVRASSQRGPEKPREPQRGTETHREAQRGPERPTYVERPREAERG